MTSFDDLLASSHIENLLDKILFTSVAVQSVCGGKERGSTLRNRKVKSLLSRWINYQSLNTINTSVVEYAKVIDDEGCNVATSNDDYLLCWERYSHDKHHNLWKIKIGERIHCAWSLL